MKLIDIRADWTERLDAILEAYYIDTTKEKDPNDPWGTLADTKTTHRLADSEQGGVSIGGVTSKKGVVTVTLDQEALDYPAEEISKQLQMVVAEFGGKHRLLEISCEDDTLWSHVEAAVNALVRRGVLADTDDPVEGSNRHLFKINQLGPRDMEGASITAQTAYASKAGGLPPDLIAKIEDQLRQPFHAHAHYKGYAAPQVQRKQAGRPDDPALLQKAVRLHQKFFGGRRWPALETALLNRANTLGKVSGDYVKPRLASYLGYMNSLKEPWPEGEKIMVPFFSDQRNLLRLAMGLNFGQDIKGAIDFLERRPALMRKAAASVFEHMITYNLKELERIETHYANIGGPAFAKEDLEREIARSIYNIRSTIDMIQGRSQSRPIRAYEPYMPYMTTDVMRAVMGDEIADKVGLTDQDELGTPAVAPPPELPPGYSIVS